MSAPIHKYDLLLVTCTCSGGHFAERLESFSKYGLLNIKGRRIKHVLLHNGSRIPDSLLSAWPCDHEVIEYPGGAVTTKLCSLYVTHLDRFLHTAKWYAKWDDDSVTDVDGLLTCLERDFDARDALYLISDTCGGIDGSIIGVLRGLGLDYMTPRTVHGKFTVQHEWEGSIQSNETMLRIRQHPIAMEFLRRCTKSAAGAPGDHPLAVAARIAKVHPTDVPFMTKDDAWEDLTIFGGRHAHVHYLAPDKGQRWHAFIARYRHWEANPGRV